MASELAQGHAVAVKMSESVDRTVRAQGRSISRSSPNMLGKHGVAKLLGDVSPHTQSWWYSAVVRISTRQNCWHSPAMVTHPYSLGIRPMHRQVEAQLKVCIR